MNANYWKAKDPEWISQQEKKWPYFKKIILRMLIDYPEQEEENLKLGYGLLTGSLTELPMKGDMFRMVYKYHTWILLHPDPTEENISLMLDDFTKKGYGDRLPVVENAMELSAHCEYLVEKGVVNPGVVDSFMNVVYGNSIEDTIRINGLDFDAVAVEMLRSYIGQLFIWFYRKSTLENVICLLPINRWVQLIYSLLIKVDDAHVEKANRVLKKFFKLLTNFENERDFMDEIKLNINRQNCDLVGGLRKEFIDSKEKYCPKLQEYVIKLEEDLKSAGIEVG